MMKKVKVEWCENFIRAAFTRHHALTGPDAGIMNFAFWNMAEASGLWERGTYGTPMSAALTSLTEIEDVRDEDGRYLPYVVFKLKPEVWAELEATNPWRTYIETKRRTIVYVK